MQRLGRNPSIDGMRGIAIALVLGWHLYHDWIRQYMLPKWGEHLTSILWSGVDLFFVLSGFLIGGILLKNRGSENYFISFYGRRAFRIIPLYIMLLAYVFASGERSDFPYLMTFTQNIAWSVDNRWGASLVGVTWSLAVEEQFYLILPLIIRFVPDKKLPVILIALALMAPVLRLFMMVNELRMPVYMLLPSRMDGLLLGVLLAWFLSETERAQKFRSIRPALKCSCIVLGLGFVALAAMSLDVFDPILTSFGYTWIAVFYASFIALVVTSSRAYPLWLMPLSWLGVGAYSLYLFHVPLRNVIIEYIGRDYQLETPVLFVQTLMLVAIGVLCWWIIEKPMVLLGHKLFAYRRSPAIDEAPR